MAAGDIQSIVVGSDGNYADITIAGVTTGGTYDFNLGAIGANNRPSAPRLTLFVTSLGFDDTGTPTTVARRVYGTKFYRKVVPNQAQAQETDNGNGTTTVRVWLSEPVYAKDQAGTGNSGTNVTATVTAGLYTQGGVVSTAASGVAVTNNSTLAYPSVLGCWTMPELGRVTGTFTIRALAFHVSGRLGRPVRAVKFTVTDGTTTLTQTVTAAAIDPAMGDAMPIPEYIATFDPTTLAQGATLTQNFVAYPWIGDTAAVLDTSVAGNAVTTGLVGPRTRICDRSGAWGGCFAVVDPVNGNDSTGAVVRTFNAGSPPAAYATIAGAATGVRAFNNTTFGRPQTAGGTIYCVAGNHAWTGGTYSATGSTTNADWLTITAYPGTARSSVVINAQSGTGNIGAMLRLLGVKITAVPTSGGVFTGSAGTIGWVDQCELAYATANKPVLYTMSIWMVTRCLVTDAADGLKPFNSSTTAFSLVRGNTVVGTGTYANIASGPVLIGNRKTTVNSTFALSSAAPFHAGWVVAYNQWSYIPVSNGLCEAEGLTGQNNPTGFAIVQNIFETVGTPSRRAVALAGDGSTNTPVDNAIIWHNVMVGERANLAYTEVAGSNAFRRGWSIKNNIFDDTNIKTDTFGTADASDTGNWSVVNGVSQSGNYINETVNVGAGGSFKFEYPGLGSIQPQGTSTLPATAPQFYNRKSYDGSTAGTGGGDYRVQPASPAVGLPLEWLLPYDLNGTVRGPHDPAGAYRLDYRPAAMMAAG